MSISEPSSRDRSAIESAFAQLEREGRVSASWLEANYPDCRGNIEAALALDALLGGGLSPSTVIGPYRVRELRGHGGMGRVFRATALEDLPRVVRGSDVALKVIHPELVGNESIQARFIREAQAGTIIDHPQVASVLDARHVNLGGHEQFLLAMEYVDGTTFRDVLAAGIVFSEEMVVGCARDVARCLRSIHAAGVVHRDIKPSNLMRAEDGRVHVLDLGLAWFQDEMIRLTKTGEFVGSFEYAAPEQFSPAFGEIDGRTDLFSLGMSLFELLTGRLPWDAAELEDAPGTAASLGGRRLRDLRPDVSPSLAAIVDRLVEPSPAARFADADALVRALDRARLTSDLAEPVPTQHEPTDGVAELRTALTKSAGGRSRLLILQGQQERVMSWIREMEDRLARGIAPPTVLRASFRSHPRGLAGILPPVDDAVRLREQAAGLVSEAEAQRAVAHFADVAQQGLVVVILEDADVATPIERAGLIRLLRGAAGHPLLLICAFADEGHIEWPELSSLEDLYAIVPLGSADTRAGVSALQLPDIDADDRSLLITAANHGLEIDLEHLARVSDRSPLSVVRLLQRVSRGRELIRWHDDGCTFWSEDVRRAIAALDPAEA